MVDVGLEEVDEGMVSWLEKCDVDLETIRMVGVAYVTQTCPSSSEDIPVCLFVCMCDKGGKGIRFPSYKLPHRLYLASNVYSVNYPPFLLQLTGEKLTLADLLDHVTREDLADLKLR